MPGGLAGLDTLRKMGHAFCRVKERKGVHHRPTTREGSDGKTVRKNAQDLRGNEHQAETLQDNLRKEILTGHQEVDRKIETEKSGTDWTQPLMSA